MEDKYIDKDDYDVYVNYANGESKWVATCVTAFLGELLASCLLRQLEIEGIDGCSISNEPHPTEGN